MEKYTYPPQELKTLESLQMPLAVYQFVDKRVGTLALSNGFLWMFDYTDREQAVYDMDHDMYATAHPDDVTRIADAAAQFATAGGVYDIIYRTRTKTSTEYRVIHAHGEHVIRENGARLAYVWYMDEGPYNEKTEGDSPEARANQALVAALHEESILRESRYDLLTGLPNLAYFFELAEAGKATLNKAGKYPVMLYMDLNGMKYYNHRNGFAEGDRLLKAFAKVLANNFSNENCCHIGADRFAAFTDETGLAEKLKRLFEEAGQMNGGKSLPVRVGIFSDRMESVPASSAYDRSKIACDQVMKTDASGFCYYSQELRDAANRSSYIITSIDRAISEKWIQVYYQPIVRAVNGKVCDEEALARWIDPAEGFLSPAEFIPYLEAGGLIYKLDLYVLEQVLEKLKAQQEAGLTVVPQSINLSRSDFEVCDIVEEIRKRVDASGIRRDLITIELTESVIGSDFDFMKEQVGRFRELGFPVWMDDFGSGYSSLDVLQSIRFDLIKFDMSFLRKLDEGDSAKIILTELMKMATSLDVDTVCEGVETEAQARFLQEIGCSKLQGYYYCRPIPFEEITERYRKGIQIGFENPEASAYYETVGRISLYDLDMVAGGDEDTFRHAFSTLPMGIIEIRGEEARFVRSNPSYREFMKQSFGIEMSDMVSTFFKYTVPFMFNAAKVCKGQITRTFFDDRMPDGSIVHSFARRIGTNPVTGCVAIAVAILSVTEPDIRQISLNRGDGRE